MKSLINKRLAFFAAFLLSSIGPLAAQHTLKGVVRDDSTRESISMVYIYLPELNITSYSNNQGFFQINNLPKGNYNIQFSHLGYEPYIKRITIYDTLTKMEVDLESTFLELPEVVVYGSQNSNLKKTSFNITSLSYKDMKENGSVSISDAMSRIPGMSQISTGVGISKPVIRGLYGNRIQTVLMGLRFDNQQWQDEHGLGISDLGVDRIEIIKGPASLLYGSEAMGGVLNIIEEKPAEIGKTKVDMNTQFFSNTRGNSTTFGYRKATEKKNWRIRAGVDTHGDYSDGNNNRVLNSRFKSYNVKGSMEYHRAKSISTFNFMSSYSKFGFISEDNIDKKEPDGRWSRKMDGPNHSVFFNILSSQNTFFREKSKIKFNVGIHSNNRQENEGGNKISLNMLLNTISSDLQWTRYLGKNTELTIGNQQMLQTNRNYGSRVIVPDANFWETGLFSYLKHSFRSLTLETGLRYDHKDIKTITPIFNPLVSTVILGMSRTYNVINGSAGGSLVFAKHWNWKFNASSGYRAPNLAELASNGLHEGTFRIEIGNPNMKVEQNLNLETTLNFEVKEFSLTGSVYRNRLINYIYLTPTGTQSLGFNIYEFIQNTSTIQGGEVQAIYNPKWFSSMQLTTSYSFIEGKTVHGDYLPFIPANRFLADVRYTFKHSEAIAKPYIKAGVNYTLKQNKPAQFETSTPGYYLINAGIGGTINLNHNPINVSITCNNLLNRTYFDHLSRFKYYGIYNMGRNITMNINIPIKN